MELKIDVYSIMNDERVMVPYFLRYYETFAQNIYIWDDDSQDGTREMLAEHPKVKFLPLEKFGDRNDYWVESVFPQYEKYSKGRADYVIIADADEFIYHPDFLGELQRQKDAGTEMLLCKGKCMMSDRLPTTDGQIFEEITHGVKDRWGDKYSIFSPDVRIRFKKGRHGYPAETPPGIKFENKSGFLNLHYRYLGEEWLRERDARNMRRLRLAGIEIRDTGRRNLPNDKHGNPYEWYRETLPKAVRVL